MSADVILVNVPFSTGGTLAPGTTDIYGITAPSDANGGGIHIQGFNVVCHAAIGAGSAPQVDLISCGTNSAVAGTLGSRGSAAYTAGTLSAGTMASYFLDGGYTLKVRFKQIAASADACWGNVCIAYQMGKAAS